MSVLSAIRSGRDSCEVCSLNLIKKFRVVKVARVFNDVEIMMQEIADIKIPEPDKYTVDEPLPEPHIKIEPIPKTDEDRMALKMIAALEKYAPGLAESFKVRSHEQPSQFVLMPTKSLIDLDMRISTDDYKKLGNPSVDDVIEIEFQAVKKS